MEELNLPSSFPTRERLTNRIQDTVAYSWAIKDFNDANINEWLNNFKGEVFPEETEKRIALWLLANYTYYSEKEIEHLCKTLYKKFIHNLAVKESLDKNGLLEKMKELCYIPLGNASESGGFIAYEFRKQAKIGIDRFFYPNEVNKFPSIETPVTEMNPSVMLNSPPADDTAAATSDTVEPTANVYLVDVPS